MATNAYAATALSDPIATRMFQLWTTHNRIYQLDLGASVARANVHWPDFATDWFQLLPLLDAARALPPTATRLKLETHKWGFVDAMAGAVAVKTENYTLYGSMMWRDKGATPSNLTKAEYRPNMGTGQLLFIPTDSGDGNGVWWFEFSDLVVVANTNSRSVVDGSRTWPCPAHGQTATDLITGTTYDSLPTSFTLPPLSAMALQVSQRGAM